MTYGPAHELQDDELLVALKEMCERIPHTMNDWEKDFSRSLPLRFLRAGITWKQRKTAREIVNRVMWKLAKLHQRPDLYIEMVPYVAPANIYTPQSPWTPPPLPTDAELWAQLSSAQREALRVLADGKQHRTGIRTDKTKVSGGAVRALERMNYVDVEQRYAGDKPKVKITERGLRLLRAFDSEATSIIDEALERKAGGDE